MLAGNHTVCKKLIGIFLIIFIFAGLGWRSEPCDGSEALTEIKPDNTSTVDFDSFQLVSQYRKAILAAARRHNTLLKVSDEDFARWMEAMLICEMGGVDWLDKPIYRELGYPIWQGMKLATSYFGRNSSVGIGQIRPETAAQLEQGWIYHQGRKIYHSVRAGFPVSGEGPRGISPQRLAIPEVSIEYLASNLEMGTIVARAFGYEPTLEDLARWQNTGMGVWDLKFGNVDFDAWLKGSRYASKVKGQFQALSRINARTLLTEDLVLSFE